MITRYPILAQLVAALTCGIPVIRGMGADFHVAVAAPAGGDGSAARPFAGLPQARDAVRAARRAGSIQAQEAVTVHVGKGVYRLDSTWELTAADGGTATAPVVYRAESPGAAELVGGVTLDPAGFRPVTDPGILGRLDATVRGKVLACDLSARVPGSFPAFGPSYRGAPPAPWLYVNDRPMTMARWPNQDAPGAGWAEFSKATDTGLPQPEAADPLLRKPHPGAFVFDDPRPARWRLDEGVWLLGYWTHDWSDEVIRVGGYDPDKKVLTLAATHGYGIAAGTWGAAKRRFFALNLLEELDSPGEWYLDRSHKQLYLIPAADLKGARIVLSLLAQPLVRISGTGHLKLQGLAFACGHGDGVVLQKAGHVEIAGCRIANCAGTGITVDGRWNVVRSCDLYGLGKGGISLNGGDRAALAPAGNLAVNNHIHHYGLFQRTYAPGIGVNGCGQVVRNNRIHDAPHNAVLYGGNEHLFEKNEVFRVVMETGDAGAFYSGRDWTSQGNVLRHNYVHDLGRGDAGHVNTMGVYLDDCDSGDTLEGNVFHRAGRAIMVGGGRDNHIRNNLVVDCPIGIHLDARGTTWKQWNSPADPSWHLEGKAERLNYTEPPWSDRYPRLARIMRDDPRQPLGNVLRDNVFIDCSGKLCDFDANTRKILDRLDIADNLVVNTAGNPHVAVAKDITGFRNLVGTPEAPVDPGFRNPATGDFSMPPEARLRKELPTFKAIPFAEIGLFRDEYRRQLPEKQLHP